MCVLVFQRCCHASDVLRMGPLRRVAEEILRGVLGSVQSAVAINISLNCKFSVRKASSLSLRVRAESEVECPSK